MPLGPCRRISSRRPHPQQTSRRHWAGDGPRAGDEPTMVTHWLAELDGRRLSVEVPASAANLGAGYDCLGLALGIVNRVDLEVRGWSRGEIELEVEGEGEGDLPADRSNRFVQGLEAVLHELRGPIPDG